jgi:hypothetical protein
MGQYHSDTIQHKYYDLFIVFNKLPLADLKLLQRTDNSILYSTEIYQNLYTNEKYIKKNITLDDTDEKIQLTADKYLYFLKMNSNG